MNDSILQFLPSAGRILIGLYFAFFGFWNIYHWRPSIEIMLQKRIPHPYFALTIGIAWQTFFGVMIMCNIHVKIAAILLIPFCLTSIAIFHPFWYHKGDLRRMHLARFIDNTTVTLGSLLLLLTTITPLTSWSDLLS